MAQAFAKPRLEATTTAPATARTRAIFLVRFLTMPRSWRRTSTESSESCHNSATDGHGHGDARWRLGTVSTMPRFADERAKGLRDSVGWRRIGPIALLGDAH